MSGEPGYYANVPISRPVVTPDAEIRWMGGFAWTEDGIRVALGDPMSSWEQELGELSDASDWLNAAPSSGGELLSG